MKTLIKSILLLLVLALVASAGAPCVAAFTGLPIPCSASTGATGPTGPTGSAGATGATGATGAGANAAKEFKVLCQASGSSYLAASAFSEPAANAATHACDSATGDVDGYEQFVNGSTNYALLGPFLLTTNFTGTLTATISFNSSSTSGSFQPSIASTCVASGGAPNTSWWTGATYTNFTSTATSGTAGNLTIIAPLSYSTGITPSGNGCNLYLAIKAGASSTPAAGANLKLLTVLGIQ